MFFCCWPKTCSADLFFGGLKKNFRNLLFSAENIFEPKNIRQNILSAKHVFDRANFRPTIFLADLFLVDFFVRIHTSSWGVTWNPILGTQTFLRIHI